MVLAHFFDVTLEAMVRRLEEMGFVKTVTWERSHENGGITDQHVRQILGCLSVVDEQKADANRPTTLRLGALAAVAHRPRTADRGTTLRIIGAGSRGTSRDLG